MGWREQSSRKNSIGFAVIHRVHPLALHGAGLKIRYGMAHLLDAGGDVSLALGVDHANALQFRQPLGNLF